MLRGTMKRKLIIIATSGGWMDVVVRRFFFFVFLQEHIDKVVLLNKHPNLGSILMMLVFG